MTEKQLQQDAFHLTQTIIEEIEEKKGENIISIDLRNIPHAVCDYFVICEGRSTTQVTSIADAVRKKVKEKLGQQLMHSEGYSNAEWILMDYFNVVVHIFQKESRAFYNLEALWADADIKKIS